MKEQEYIDLSNLLYAREALQVSRKIHTEDEDLRDMISKMRINLTYVCAKFSGLLNIEIDEEDE